MRIAKIKWAMPHCYALIFFIIILVALLTWCIPSGSFDYHSVTLPGGETKTLVIPGLIICWTKSAARAIYVRVLPPYWPRRWRGLSRPQT